MFLGVQGELGAERNSWEELTSTVVEGIEHGKECANDEEVGELVEGRHLGCSTGSGSRVFSCGWAGAVFSKRE